MLQLISELIELLRRDKFGTLRFGTERLDSGNRITDNEIEALKNVLYERYYLTGGFPWQRRDSSLLLWTTPASFVAALVECLGLGSALEAGWLLEDEREDLVHINKGGLRLSCSRALLTACDSANPIQSHTSVSLAIDRVRKHMSTGFVAIASQCEPRYAGPVLKTRWYFNLHPLASRPFCKDLINRLDEGELNYLFKLLADPREYWRNDTAVLYAPNLDYGEVNATIRATLLSCRGALRCGVPLMTKQIFPGIAVAQDPGTGESFGLNRCQLLAQAAIEVLDSHGKLTASSISSIEQRILSNGVDLYQPYLRLGQKDMYTSIGDAGSRWAADRSNELMADEALSYIFQAIDSSRIRCQGQPLWLTREWVDGDLTLEMAQSDVYGGLPGIAWFLAEYYCVFRDPSARDLALNVWKGIQTHARLTPHERRHGLYNGLLGACLLGERIGRALGDDDIGHEAEALARVMLASLASPDIIKHTDWIGGLAGTVGGLISIWRIWGTQDALSHACRIADEIVKRARVSKNGLSWRTSIAPRSRPLLGFAHGVGGIALALAELASVMEDKKYKESSEAAFAYERSFFSHRETGWPDLRTENPAYPFAWCHGTPGVLLAHAIANQVSKGAIEWNSNHDAAVARTERELLQRLDGRDNLCQCHGVTGNAEILRLLPRCIPFEPAIGLELRDYVAAAVNSEIATNQGRAAFDCSLMLGLSGIGLYLLGTREDGNFPAPLTLGTNLWHDNIRK